MKQKIKMIVPGILLLLILVSGGYYLMKDGGSTKDSKETWLCTMGAEDIASISVSSQEDDQTLVFTREESSWKGSDGSSYKNDQFAAYTAVLGYMKSEEVKNATASNGASNPQRAAGIKEDRIQEYGLEKPRYTVSVSYKDETKYSYNLGQYVEDLGMYLTADGKENVYLIDPWRAETMQEMVLSLYDVALTSVKFDEIRGIRIFTPEDGVISMNRSEAPRADGNFYWNMFQPYAWNADTGIVNHMIQEAEKNGVLKRTKSHVTAAQCGLDQKEDKLPSITFYDTYDSELTLYFGQTEGEYVYCRTNDLQGIYLIDQEILSLLKLGADGIIDTSLYYYEVPSVGACHIKWQEETFELGAKWVLDDGEKRGQRYTLNGNSITGAEYRTITDWFTDTKVKQVVSSSEDEGDVIGTISMERLSAPYEQTITFRTVPDNESLVQADLGQSAAAYIERQEAEEFITSLRR